MIYNMKNKNTFFSPGETDIVIPSSGEVVAPTIDSEKSVILPYTSSKTKRKKRNLVSSMGPLIIKVTETKEIEYEKNGETVKEVVPYKINKSYNDILNAYLNDQKIKLLYKEQMPALSGMTPTKIRIEASDDVLEFNIVQISKFQFYGITAFGDDHILIASSPDEPMVFQNAIQDELHELINGDNSLVADPTGEQEVVVNPTPGKVVDVPDPRMT